MKSFMLILFVIVLTNVVAESENKEQILRRLQKLEEIVQDERVINTQQQLTIDRQNTVIQNLESEIDKLNGKVKANSSGMIFHSLLSLYKKNLDFTSRVKRVAMEYHMKMI